MKKKQLEEGKRLRKEEQEVMEISSTGYGYEFHQANETRRVKSIRGK